MKAGVRIEHHDPHYLERRGGVDLLTHLLGSKSRADYRRASIARALDLFETAEDGGQRDDEVGGLGLIVLQRALLAAEDLGGLLHGLQDSDHWGAMRGAKIDQIDQAFTWATEHPESLFRVFLLADRETLEAEGLAADDVELLLRLCQRTARRWGAMLNTCALLWFPLRNVAKATMHGFPIWAGSFVFEPPGGGALSAGLPRSRHGRCAVLAASTEHPQSRTTEIRTQRDIVRLDREAVRGYARHGRVASRLYNEICLAQAESRTRGFAALVPFRLARFMNESDRARLDHLAADDTNTND